MVCWLLLLRCCCCCQSQSASLHWNNVSKRFSTNIKQWPENERISFWNTDCRRWNGEILHLHPLWIAAVYVRRTLCGPGWSINKIASPNDNFDGDGDGGNAYGVRLTMLRRHASLSIMIVSIDAKKKRVKQIVLHFIGITKITLPNVRLFLTFDTIDFIKQWSISCDGPNDKIYCMLRNWTE